MPAPHYQGHQQFGFGCVTPPPPTGLVPSFRSYQDERPRMLCVGEDENSNNANMHYMRDARQQGYMHEQLPSPNVKREQYVSSSSPVSMKAALASKTITPNIAANAENQTEFHTEVDTLMKTIQAKADEAKPPTAVDRGEASYPSPPHVEPKFDAWSRAPSPEAPVASTNVNANPSARNMRKRYVCCIRDCNKRFAQKTHLDIHKRAHTGEKPYLCKQPNCGQRFSQLGNLKTHERRHTGEKPYHCELCGKAFAQRGNVRAHKEVHNNYKRFTCKLDGCQKKFSQLGNMKTHQNKFHAPTIKILTSKFAAIVQAGGEMTEDDKELFEYFAIHYKNSNKGIKGRGKDRKVGTVNPGIGAGIPSHYPIQQNPSMQQQQQQQHMPHGLPHPGVSHSGAFGNYGSHNMLVGRDTRRGYEMYDMDQDSISGSVTASSTTGTMYEDEHAFPDRFQDRLY